MAQGIKSANLSDLELRVRLSKLALFHSAVVIAAWFGYFLWIGNPAYAKAAMLPGALYLPAGLLFLLGWNYVARVYSLVSLAPAFLMLSILLGDQVNPEIFFFLLMGLPFLLLSWTEERRTILAVVAVQSGFGFFALSLDIFGIPQGMQGASLTEAQAKNVDWGIRITVAALLLLQMIYFSILNSNAQRRATKALQRANTAARTKGEFLANMSHEIRTPMNGVIGMIEVLETMDLNPQQARSVSTIRNSAFALLRILDDILDASRIEAGKLNVEKTKVELRPLLEGVSQTLQSMADEKGVELRLLINQTLPEWIWADSGRLRQILLNLITNAIKYSSKNLTGHTGTVVLNAQNNGDELLVLKIKDNGIGMSEEIQDKLFEPFMQGEQSSRRRVGGTGLGLVITKNLIQLMGGEIQVESEEGEGTKITVSLPLEPADGPSRLPDLSGLHVVCYRIRDELIHEGLENILGTGGIVTSFVDDWEHAAQLNPDRMNETIVIFPPMDETERTREQDKFEERFPGTRFIHCSPVRSDRFGFVAEKTYRIQIFPMMTSELYQALAALSGKAPREDSFAAADAAAPAPATTPGQNRVLIVEDNEINKAVLSKQLEILGYPHDLASDGMEGFHKWESGDFDLILTDCHMPRMDGFEMVAAIRAEEQQSNRRAVPIIAITANALGGEADKCLASGMNAYLAKPVELNALKSQMARLLAKRQKSGVA